MSRASLCPPCHGRPDPGPLPPCLCAVCTAATPALLGKFTQFSQLPVGCIVLQQIHSKESFAFFLTLANKKDTKLCFEQGKWLIWGSLRALSLFLLACDSFFYSVLLRQGIPGITLTLLPVTNIVFYQLHVRLYT